MEQFSIIYIRNLKNWGAVSMDRKLYGISVSLFLALSTGVFMCISLIFDAITHRLNCSLVFSCITFSFDESILLKITLFHFRSGSKKKTLKFPTSSAEHGNRQRWNTIQYNGAQQRTAQNNHHRKKNERIYHIYRKAREKKNPIFLEQPKRCDEDSKSHCDFQSDAHGLRDSRTIHRTSSHSFAVGSWKWFESEISILARHFQVDVSSFSSSSWFYFLSFFLVKSSKTFEICCPTPEMPHS